MTIKVWGSRGSLTTPGKETLRYGGNTTCVEVRPRDGRVIILDAGSGLRRLGQALLATGELDLQMFLTHAHWDHLCGFPFFAPAYHPACHIAFCGGPSAQQSLQRFLAYQMESPFFPVPFDRLQAKFDFTCRDTGDATANSLREPAPLGGHSVRLNHPDGGYGFKLTEDGRTFAFLPDNELDFSHPGAATFAEQVEFCRGADLLFHDAQYTEVEYQRTRGWGHSTYGAALRLARAAGVKRLGLFHHDPGRTDDDLDEQVAWCREQLREAGSPMECFACAEDMVIEL